MQVKISCRSVLWMLLICSTSAVHGWSSPLDMMRTAAQPSNPPVDKVRFRVDQSEARMDERKEVYRGVGEGNELVKVMSQIGSKPPRCQSKCNSCQPCEAVQVPAVPQSRKITRDPTTPSAGTQEYSNYKPMSWKCKCGDKIFNP